MLEDQFAGEENTVGKLLMDHLGELGQLLDGVGAEGEIGFGCKIVVVTVVYKVAERAFGFLAHALQVLATAVALGIDRAHVHEQAVLEVPGKFAAHPLQRVDATAPA
jgi:hypothetical protein